MLLTRRRIEAMESRTTSPTLSSMTTRPRSFTLHGTFIVFIHDIESCNDTVTPKKEEGSSREESASTAAQRWDSHVHKCLGAGHTKQLHASGKSDTPLAMRRISAVWWAIELWKSCTRYVQQPVAKVRCKSHGQASQAHTPPASQPASQPALTSQQRTCSLYQCTPRSWLHHALPTLCGCSPGP